MSVFERLNELGQAVDAAEDAGNFAKLNEPVVQLKSLLAQTENPAERARVHYYCANALTALNHLQSDEGSWWNRPFFQEEMVQRRLALKELEECDGEETLECQVLTNLANAFNRAGRFSEALGYWNKALNINKDFGMALGNRGRCYYDYARYVQSKREQAYLLRDGHTSLRKALKAGVEEHAFESIKSMLDHLTTFGKLRPLELPLSEALSPQERDYRHWCRENGLLLSPLNDLFQLEGVEDITDSLHLPSIFVHIEDGTAEPPAVYGMFNQAKQEFVSARYLAFEAIRESESDTLHFSDRDVALINMLDYRLYRLWVERLKMSFLSAHAILDKLAYLMNLHWKFGLASDKVSFGGIWYRNGRTKDGISSRTKELQNWPLQGLFWLSRDFYYSVHATGKKAPGQTEPDTQVPPEARMLHEIRNHIAHKYLRTHDEIIGYLPPDREERLHDLSFQVTGEELKRHTLHLLKLVRSAMMYLTAAVAHEENEKSKKRGSVLTVPMTMFPIKDDDRM